MSFYYKKRVFIIENLYLESLSNNIQFRFKIVNKISFLVFSSFERLRYKIVNCKAKIIHDPQIKAPS